MSSIKTDIGARDLAGRTQFSPSATIPATDVQRAIEYIRSLASATAWGGITGTLSAQADLQAALDAKVTGSGSSSGTNTGDQNLFSTIAVSGQSNVVADQVSDTLTLIAGTNIAITTNAGTDAVTINATGSGDMVLASAQTNTALKTFLDATFGLRNVANTFTSLFTNAATAARTYTLKDASGTLAFTSDITGTNSGTNTGDVTLAGTPNYITIAGQVITRALIDLATHVTGKLPLANMADVATATVFYRKTAATGVPEVQTLATLKTDLALTGTNSGDQTSIVGITGTIAQFNTAITDGDLATGGGTATGANTGDVTVTGTPSYITLAGQVITRALIDLASHITGRLPFANLTQGSARSVLGVTGNAAADNAAIQGTADQVLRVDTAGTGLSFGTVATAGIANDAITYAKLQNVSATSRFLGRITAAAGVVEELTGTQATTLLDVAVPAGAKGLVPATVAGDATKFLRGDMTFVAVPGGGDALVANPLSQFAPTTSAQLRTVLSDETGTGLAYFQGGDMGTPSAGVLTNATGLPTAGLVNNAVTNAKAAQMAAKTFKGNNGTATADPIDLTVDQSANMLPRGPMERGERLVALMSSDFMNATSPFGPFVAAAISAGTFAGTTTATAHHPGSLTLTSSTTANSGIALQTNVTQILLGGGEQFDCVFKTPAAFTSITTRLGFHDSTTSADAVDGAYFEISTAGVVTGKTSSNSTRTTSATIATLTVSTWYHARVKVNAGATAVDFTIWNDSGTQQGTVQNTTNIPTAAGRECGVVFTVTNAGTVATVSGIVDYMSFGYQGRTLSRGALT